MQKRPYSDNVSEKIVQVDNIPEDVVFIRLTGLEEINWSAHSHNRHQIIYVLSGTLHVETDDLSYFAGDRHFVWIPRGVNHRLSSNNSRISLMVIYFCHSSDVQEHLSVFLADDFVARNLEYIAGQKLISRSATPELYGYVVSLFRLMPKVCREGVFPALPVISGRNVRIVSVLKYISDNLEKELSLSSVASATGYSVRNLTRLFTGAGIRFVHFVNYRRVVRAMEILTDSDISIEQAAYCVGFNSPGTFSRVFRRITGESPSEFLGRR